jgi:type IX secretion system PorP/SprF family membrane protein
MNIKFKYHIITLLLTLSFISLAAQQEPNYTFYRFNMNLINPAYAGASDMTEIGLNIRSQWAGVQGAPETQSLVFGTSLGKNVGIGLSIVNDKTFIENQTSVALDFSYKLKINENNDLFFGIKGSFASYDANTEGLLTYGIQQDMSLMNIDGRFNPNVGTGVYLKNENYFLSFSIPKILTPDRLEQSEGLARLGIDKVHYYLAGGYDFSLSESTVLKPSVLFRYVDASPVSLDFTTLVEFNSRFDIGAAYRLAESISGLLLFKAGWVDIGYAYEVALENPIRNSDNGTHEIIMSLRL